MYPIKIGFGTVRLVDKQRPHLHDCQTQSPSEFGTSNSANHLHSRASNLLLTAILHFSSTLNQIWSSYIDAKHSINTLCPTHDLHWTHPMKKTYVGAVSARRQNFATILRCLHNQSRMYERSRTEFGAYRFAYLLLPLQHIGHRVVAGELDVAVEHN